MLSLLQTSPLSRIPPPSTRPPSSCVQVSNEVLLRSKIAQLEGKRNRNGPKKTSAASGGGGGKSGKRGARKGSSRNAAEGADGVGGTTTALQKNEMDILIRFDQKVGANPGPEFVW